MDLNYYKKYEPIDGKWYITKELGSGSFGTVFEVTRKDFPDMKSAMKIISIPNSQSEVRSYREENYDLDEQSVTSYFYGFVEEFVKEFKLMSQLRGNSNIVSYEDHDVKKHEDGIGWDIFIRMELLKPMGQYFSKNTPSNDDIIKLGIDICKALEVCKKYNIIHRDIKPSNIFVSDTGDYKLGDFGVARTLEKTSSGLSKKGTYTYMAPEVFKGEKYGANVDIYSLGIVMYKLLNNNLEPFRTDRTYNDGERAMELRMQGQPLPKPANAEGKLAEIVLKACNFNPQERYQSPSQMREDLEHLGNNEIDSTSSDTLDDLDHKSPRRSQIINDNDKGETASREGTVGLFGDENKRILSEQEIVKLAFAREPANINTSHGRAIGEQCLSRILPIYDAVQPLSNVIKLNNNADVKELMNKADTDTLLVCFKTSAYYISKGDDKVAIGEFQKNIIEQLKTRNFAAIEAKQPITKPPLNENSADISSKNRKKVDINKTIYRIKDGFMKKWKLWTTIIAVVLLALIASLVICKIDFSGHKVGGGKSGMLVVEFYPGIDVSRGELKSIEEGINERASVLGVKYDTKVGDNRVVLEIEENFAETIDQKKYILDLLGTNGAMGIASGYSMEIEDCKSGFTKIEVESENREKFMDYFGDKMASTGLSNTDTKTQIESLTGENIYYLHVELDKKTALDFTDCAEATDKQNAENGKVTREMSGMFDFVRHNSLVSGGIQMDWTTAGTIIKIPNADEFFLFPASNAAESSKCLELLKKVLETDSLKTGCSYSIIEEPKWETEEEQFGAYQQQDIEDEYIVALFDLGEYYSEELDDESYKLVIENIKKRLDSLKIPYSMGYSGLYGKNLSLKISPKYMNSDMVRFIANPGNIEFYSQFDKAYLYHEKFEIDNDQNGNLCLKVKFSGYKNEVIAKYLEKIPGALETVSEDGTTTESTFDISTGSVYLVVNDVTVAGAKITDLQDDSSLCFSNLLCYQKDSISNDDVPFLELLQQIDQESYLGYNWTLESIKYYKKGEYVTDDISEIPWGYKGSDVDDNIKNLVESHGGKVTKSFKSRNALEITINVEEGLDFATNYMDKVKEIYKACNFDDCSHASIWFYEEDAGENSPIDAAQFEFSKATYGAMKMSWIVFDGPEYGKYAEEIERICETDEFYKEKTDKY